VEVGQVHGCGVSVEWLITGIDEAREWPVRARLIKRPPGEGGNQVGYENWGFNLKSFGASTFVRWEPGYGPQPPSPVPWVAGQAEAAKQDAGTYSNLLGKAPALTAESIQKSIDELKRLFDDGRVHVPAEYRYGSPFTTPSRWFVGIDPGYERKPPSPPHAHQLCSRCPEPVAHSRVSLCETHIGEEMRRRDAERVKGAPSKPPFRQSHPLLAGGVFSLREES
jgi:hypothetical protein